MADRDATAPTGYRIGGGGPRRPPPTDARRPADPAAPGDAVASAATTRIPAVGAPGAHAIGRGASRRVRWSRRLVVLVAALGTLAVAIVAGGAPTGPSGASGPAAPTGPPGPVPGPATPDATQYTPPNAVVELPPSPSSPTRARSTAPSDGADR